MKDVSGLLCDLRRPRLLIRAARAGVEDYVRDIHLPRLMPNGLNMRSGPLILNLMEHEAVLDEQRRKDDASYSVTRHIEFLVAMMAEARNLRRPSYDD